MIEAFPTTDDAQTRLKRARMRAWRRGMREMDLILGGFIDAHGPTLDQNRLDAFESVLARRDQDLYDWISERRTDSLGEMTEAETAILTEIRETWRTIEEN
jgi:antitoxin CptB